MEKSYRSNAKRSLSFPIAFATRFLALLLIAIAPLSALRAQSNYATPYTFTTLAGAAHGYGSEDGSGNAARFYAPYSVAMDSSGNVYVADTQNQAIRKITSSGIVTTLAGGASYGSADGTGSAAQFLNPKGVAVDTAGNVYVADTGNYTIRKITPAGVVTTLAGSAGDFGSTDGTGNEARFTTPCGVAVDGPGNVYVADTDNATIRKVTPAGVVTTLAGSVNVYGSVDGTGSAANFYFPTGLAVDGSGNVYVADSNNHTIRKVSALGEVTTFAGSAGSSGSVNGTGVAALFNTPTGVALDGAGNIYVADSNNHAIRKISSAGVVTTIAGIASSSGSSDGTGSAALFNQPTGITVDIAGIVYAADSSNHNIRKITSDGVVTTFAGTTVVGGNGSTDGTGSEARFYNPRGIAVDNSGNVFVADSENCTIRKITPAGVVTTLAGMAGNAGSTDGTGSAARFLYPDALTVDGAGNVYVADTGNNTIRKITSAGVVTTLAGSAGLSGSTNGSGNAARFNYPLGITVDEAGIVYVADSSNHMIRKITPEGVVTTFFDGESSIILYFPMSVAVDGANNVFVADAGHYAVQKITQAGVITLVAGSGDRFVFGSDDGTGSAARFGTQYSKGPLGLAIDGAGNLYASDNEMIRKITPGGVVTTLAGMPGRSGWIDGTGSAVRFGAAAGVAVDGAGNIYVAETGNQVVRKGLPPVAPTISLQPLSQTVVGGYPVTFTTTASGLPEPTYQWQKNDVAISGATGSSYTITNVVEGDAGSYTLVATNPVGVVTSSIAALTVIPAGFDLAAYLSLYPDVATMFTGDPYGAWLYYRNQGIYDGEVFDDLFRVEEYLALYPELFAIFESDLGAALDHWLSTGRLEGKLGRIPLEFSATGYFARNPDVATAVGNDPVLAWGHYWLYGIYEGRAYDDELRVFEYLAINADLTAAFVNDWRQAALHWMRYGRTEGRLGRLPLTFSVSEYLVRSPDVAAVWGTDPTTVFLHFWLYGIDEARTYDDLFRVDEYLALNPDLTTAFGTDRRRAFKHWVRYGQAEGRSGKYP